VYCVRAVHCVQAVHAVYCVHEVFCVHAVLQCMQCMQCTVCWQCTVCKQCVQCTCPSSACSALGSCSAMSASSACSELCACTGLCASSACNILCGGCALCASSACCSSNIFDVGLKIKKIHRGISFFDDAWLKPYINLNTQLRTKDSNLFDNDFLKLMNNSDFGKTMENIRNRVNFHLVNSQKSLKGYSEKPNFHHLTIFDENLVAVNMKKTELVFNKPVYLGRSILDISKMLMNNFHYNYIKKMCGSKPILLMTDADSFMFEIKTGDFFKDISGDVREKLDTSNFPQNHP